MSSVTRKCGWCRWSQTTLESGNPMAPRRRNPTVSQLWLNPWNAESYTGLTDRESFAMRWTGMGSLRSSGIKECSAVFHPVPFPTVQGHGAGL